MKKENVKSVEFSKSPEEEDPTIEEMEKYLKKKEIQNNVLKKIIEKINKETGKSK
jgi:signal recognition particle GTPase